MNLMNDPIQEYQKHFTQVEKLLNGETGTSFHALRTAAIDTLLRGGFPAAKQEDWRFTNIQPITSKTFLPAQRGSASSLAADTLARIPSSSSRMVFVNGFYAPDLSRISVPTGVIVGNLSELKRTHADAVRKYFGASLSGKESGFTALNMSFVQDGFCLIVPDGVTLGEPISFVYLSTSSLNDASVHPRNLIVMGERSAATLVEYYGTESEGAYLTNAVTEIFLGPGSTLEHDKVQLESLKAFHIASMHVTQQAGSTFVSNNIALGARLARTDVTSVLSESGSSCTLNGLTVANGTQVIDNHTTIDHATPNCNSWEVYKAILDGESRGIFNGKIFVRPDAQKTDAKQTNKTLLLSDSAMIDTKPQLEIFADDVKCTHGATVGQLDEEQVHYLRTRGISAEAARDMLTFAFAREVVQEVHFPALREGLEATIHARLDEGRGRRV